MWYAPCCGGSNAYELPRQGVGGKLSKIRLAQRIFGASRPIRAAEHDDPFTSQPLQYLADGKQYHPAYA